LAEEIGNTQEQAPPGPDSGSEPDLAQEFETLWQQVAALRYRWQTLMELYGKGQDRLDLLNRTAPTFFGLTRNLLIDRVLLDLARLLDVPRLGRRDNLVLDRLAMRAGPMLTPEARQAAKDHLQSARLVEDRLARVRNRRIAHLDLEVALGKAKPHRSSLAKSGPPSTPSASS
jgi:hypothetical protein